VDADAVEEIFRRGWSTKGPSGNGTGLGLGLRLGPGRGLGLALVRQAVRRGGGTIELGRSSEGGAEFTVRLPLRAEVGT
jgi:signal transduction histidine kinase